MSDQSVSRIERKRQTDEQRRARIGDGPGELTATFGFVMDWGPALSKLKAWCQRYEKMGALHIAGQYERLKDVLESEARSDLVFALEYAQDDADRWVPRDTGYLASTGSFGIEPVGRGGYLAVGRYTASYAAVVHEEPAMKRATGTRKWLEIAFNTGWAEFMQSIRHRLALAEMPAPVLIDYDSVHGRLTVVPGRPGLGRDPTGRFRSLRGATPRYE